MPERDYEKGKSVPGHKESEIEGQDTGLEEKEGGGDLKKEMGSEGQGGSQGGLGGGSVGREKDFGNR